MFAPDTPPRDAEGYPPMGAIMDHNDHPSMDQPDPGHTPRMKHSTDMAGDVIPIPGEKSMGSGATSSAIPYALGTASNPKVISIGAPTVKSWYERRR